MRTRISLDKQGRECYHGQFRDKGTTCFLVKLFAVKRTINTTPRKSCSAPDWKLDGYPSEDKLHLSKENGLPAGTYEKEQGLLAVVRFCLDRRRGENITHLVHTRSSEESHLVTGMQYLSDEPCDCLDGDLMMSSPRFRKRFLFSKASSMIFLI